MSDIRKYGLTRPHLWLIRAIGVIVPRRVRAGWRQEGEAELRYREELLAEWDRLDWRNKLDLLRRSVGANTVVFSGVYAMLFPPLPYQNSERLEEPSHTGRQEVAFGVSHPDFTA